MQRQPLEAIDIDYSFVNQVNRIFGPDQGASPAELEGKNYCLRLDSQWSEAHQLSGYYYQLHSIGQARSAALLAT